jgi:lipopolysaccharide exporter
MTAESQSPDAGGVATPRRRRTSFAGDVARLVSGSVVAQIIGVLAAPILTRLYAPAAFGDLALFSAITGIVGVVVCLRYELAIMLPKTDEEAANVLGVSLSFALLVSSLMAVAVWLGGTPLLSLLNAEALAPYLWMAPVTVLFGGLFAGLSYWNSRAKQFGRLSVALVTDAFVTTVTSLTAGVTSHATSGAMIGATVGGQATATAALGGQIWRDDRKLFVRSIRWQDMLAASKRYRKFPLYNTWAALLNTLSWRLPAFLLAAFFSTTVVGYYALGFRILQLPMSLIGSAISQVFYPRAAEAKVQGTLASLVEEVFRRLVIIGMFPMLILTIIGQDVFMVVFGPSWAEAGVYTQILAIWAFFWFISSPMSILFSVLEKQELSLRFNIVLFATRFGSLWLGGYLGNARLAILLFAATGILLYGYLSLMIMAVAGVAYKRALAILGRTFGYFLPFGVVIALLSRSGAQDWIVLLTAAISLIAYGLLMWKQHPDLLQLRF